MKKLYFLAVVAVVLLAAAIILTSSGFVGGKDTKGAGVICVFIDDIYDNGIVETAKKTAGLERATILDSGKTYVELELSGTDAADIAAKGQKFLDALKADYASADLVYAETYSGRVNTAYLLHLTFALVAFAVIACPYCLR